MERRRRALGLKKSGVTPEKSDVTGKSSRRISTDRGECSKLNSEDKTRGITSQKSQPSGTVTPKQKIQICRNVTPLKPDSPCSPLQSPGPGSQMVFLGSFASPEIEVSWDWSCSQVPNDMLPPKRPVRVQDKKSQQPALSTINTRLRPRPPLQEQISEEENQQRLEYYKSILSMKPADSPSNGVYSSTNNNIEDVSSDASKCQRTPKRPSTRLSSASKKRDEDNTFFDDSANEFMIECSQAIEEKLKNGEIDMGPIVNIKSSQGKRLHSPGDTAISHKKTCHGRVNLFPENSNCDELFLEDNDDCNEGSNVIHQAAMSNNNNHSDCVMKRNEPSCMKTFEDKFKNTSITDSVVKKPSRETLHANQNSHSLNNLNNNNLSRNNSVNEMSNSNYQDLERRSHHVHPDQSSSNMSQNKKVILVSQNRCSERVQGNVTTKNHQNIQHNHKPQGSHITLYKDNQGFVKPQQPNNNLIRNQHEVQSQNSFSIQDKSKTSDITSLLDDDFDLELSSLDVDSLCSNSGNKDPKIKNVTTCAPKMCTQQEIEAKRLAALQKLRMKTKR